MKPSRFLRKIAALAAAGAIFSASCGSDGASVDQVGETVSTVGSTELIEATVGIVGPKSGVAPAFWIESLRGFKLALPEVEELYGVRITIIEADDEGSPEIASREVQRLLNIEQVDAILGPAQSGPALQVSEIIQRAGRPWLISVAAADAVLDESRQPNSGFRFQNTNQQTIDVTADLLFREGNTVGIFYSAEGYGQSNLDQLMAKAESQGREIAAEEGFEPGTADLTSAVRRMKNAGVNAVFFAVSNGSDIATLVRAMEQADFNPTTKISPTTILTEFIDLASPEQWKGIIIPDPRDLAGGPYSDMMAFYEETYGEPPILSAAVFPSYTAALGYGQAVAAAKDAGDYEAVIAALQELREINVWGRVFEAPFSVTDRNLYSNDASTWFLHEFDENGVLRSLGTAK